MSPGNRKTKFLALAAGVIFIFMVVTLSHRNVTKAVEVPSYVKDPPSSKIEQLKNKNGELDESKVKTAEEKFQKEKQPDEGLTKGDDGTSFDPRKEFTEIMKISPVVVFSKSYCPFSKALKELLGLHYEITPPPAYVELDKHKNGQELQKYIGDKSGRTTVPNLFINGVSRGGSDDLKQLHLDGLLLKSLKEWGGTTVQVQKLNAPSNS